MPKFNTVLNDFEKIFSSSSLKLYLQMKIIRVYDEVSENRSPLSNTRNMFVVALRRVKFARLFWSDLSSRAYSANAACKARKWLRLEPIIPMNKE